jgi:hypothetical protein
VSVVNYGANPNTAGAQLNSRDLAGQLARLSPDEQRALYDRLAAASPRAPEPADEPRDLDLYQARARALAL